MKDMGIGIECLLADDIGRARALAAVLHAINQERRGVQQQMTEEAETALQQAAGDPSPAVSLFDPDWHPGVVGLVASKLKERLHRPAIAWRHGHTHPERCRVADPVRLPAPAAVSTL